jgi:hypothetical protein
MDRFYGQHVLPVKRVESDKIKRAHILEKRQTWRTAWKSLRHF